MPPQLKEIVEEPVEVHAPTGSSIAATLADGMEQIKAHGRFLWMNSREMKLVKARYEETIDLLNERLAADNYEDIRARLMVSLSALSEVCEAYKSAKIADPFTDNSPRHQGVLRILNASRQALHFFENCSEEQVLAQKEEGKPESLVDFMRRQKEPVTEDKKKEAEARDQAMKMGHAILVSNIELLDINSSRLSEIYYRYNNEIHQFIQNRLPVDEQVFKEKKDGLLEGYGNMISYLKDYITHAKPVYKDAIRRMNAARQVYSQLVREKNRLKLLDFSKLEKLGRAGTASWEAVILPGVARVTETEQNGRKQYDMDSGHKGYFYSETNNTEDINLLGNMAGAPTQIFRTYEPAVLKKSDGSLKKGYVYTHNTRDEVNLVSMTDIINNAQKNGVGISYTDEALRQLSCIQVMDVLCGKKKRSQKSLLYSARMTDIQGEQAIVISGVMSVENEGYFSEETYESLKNGASIKEEKKASCNDIVKQEFYSAIEDEEGKLRLAYYDADMADRILALDADTFFAEMQMKLSDEQKDAFRNRLHGLQEFFAKDKQSGIRKEVEDYENEKRKRLVRRVEKKINKLKNAKSDNSATFQEQARRKIEEAKNYKAWKELSLYRNRMKNYADTTGISGYAVASLVSGEKYSSKDPVLTGLSERHKRTVTNTVNKIRAAKEFKKGYVSHSEALRKGSKQSFLNKTREDVELENTSD
ncbi:MAG: hypothetical protein IJV04_02250, partial [Lachnospiraceae bacterium]|nr:hypothetical protein [Lachnospiraceae bacterium]